MTPEQHALVKDLFARARQLEQAERDAFLRRECGGDEQVYNEVHSLMKFDTNDTVLMLGPMTTQGATAPRMEQRGRRVLGRIERVAIRILHELLGNRRRRLLVVIAVAFGLGSLAWWSFDGMKSSTESIAAAELTTILDAEVKALELWIEEKKKDVRLFSSLPEIRRTVQELVRIAESEDEPRSALLASEARSELNELLQKYDRIVGRPEQDGVISRDGLLLATAHDETIGSRLNDNGMAAVRPAFRGDTFFVRPSPDGSFNETAIADLNAPVLYVVAPIHSNSPEQEIIAVAAFGFPADDEFSDILSVARQGESGETFAFDTNGLLLNESRFDQKLKESGLLDRDPEVRSILRVEIRDPGEPPFDDATTSLELASRPLTELARKAIASGRKGSGEQQHGVILKPYRTYRGVRVIGAWRWLPEYDMAVATEVEVDEQYRPMRYPVIADRIRLGMLAGSVLLLFVAASWIVMLDRDLQHAQQLGQYVLEKEIGRGGMGVVYRANHALMHRPTAIKLLRPETVNDASLARFEREVQLASGLTHPNTIEVFDFGRTPDGSFYCVMELLNGRTLEEIVRLEGPFEPRRASHVLAQIAGSLSEAHGKGIVHRDIKPSNIMLCEIGGIADVVKVLDFGLARTVERADGKGITQVGLVLGTPPYLAPESITDPMTIDPRSDLYSLGAVAYYLLTGQEVYEGTSVGDLIHKTLSEDPRQPHDVIQKKLPQPLEGLVMACLEKRPEDRPQDIRQVIDELERAEHSVGQL